MLDGLRLGASVTVFGAALGNTTTTLVQGGNRNVATTLGIKSFSQAYTGNGNRASTVGRNSGAAAAGGHHVARTIGNNKTHTNP